MLMKSFPLRLVGDLSPAVQRHKPVVLARVDHLDPGEVLSMSFPSLSATPRVTSFSRTPLTPMAPWSLSAVACVDDDHIQLPPLPLLVESGLHLPLSSSPAGPCPPPPGVRSRDQDVVGVVCAHDLGGGHFARELEGELDGGGRLDGDDLPYQSGRASAC